MPRPRYSGWVKMMFKSNQNQYSGPENANLLMCRYEWTDDRRSCTYKHVAYSRHFSAALPSAEESGLQTPSCCPQGTNPLPTGAPNGEISSCPHACRFNVFQAARTSSAWS